MHRRQTCATLVHVVALGLAQAAWLGFDPSKRDYARFMVEGPSHSLLSSALELDAQSYRAKAIFESQNWLFGWCWGEDDCEAAWDVHAALRDQARAPRAEAAAKLAQASARLGIWSTQACEQAAALFRARLQYGLDIPAWAELAAALGPGERQRRESQMAADAVSTPQSAADAIWSVPATVVGWAWGLLLFTGDVIRLLRTFDAGLLSGLLFAVIQLSLAAVQVGVYFAGVAVVAFVIAVFVCATRG